MMNSSGGVGLPFDESVMGWDFYCNPVLNKAYIVREKVAGDDMVWDGVRGKVLAHSLRGNRLWRAIEKPNGERFIALDLLKSGGRGEGWGYKELCETMGPCEVDCPLYMLDLVPEPANNYGWREEVRAYHAARREKARVKLEPNMPVTIYGRPYRLLRKAQRRGWLVKDGEGNIYHASRGIVPAKETA